MEKVSFWGCYCGKFQVFLPFPRHHLQTFLNRWKRWGQLTPIEWIICCRHQCFTLLCSVRPCGFICQLFPSNFILFPERQKAACLIFELLCCLLNPSLTLSLLPFIHCFPQASPAVIPAAIPPSGWESNTSNCWEGDIVMDRFGWWPPSTSGYKPSIIREEESLREGITLKTCNTACKWGGIRLSAAAQSPYTKQ